MFFLEEVVVGVLDYQDFVSSIAKSSNGTKRIYQKWESTIPGHPHLYIHSPAYSLKAANNSHHHTPKQRPHSDRAPFKRSKKYQTRQPHPSRHPDNRFKTFGLSSAQLTSRPANAASSQRHCHMPSRVVVCEPAAEPVDRWRESLVSLQGLKV